MLDIFNREEVTQGILSPPGWRFIKDGLQNNLKTVKDYYHQKPFAVKSNHILIRLLNNIGVSYNIDNYRFVSILSSRQLGVSMNFKMSSSIYRGNIFKSIFYLGVDEVIIAEDDPFDISYVYENWENISAVKILHHPKSDLNLQLPNGNYVSSELGYAVISVNIAMLGLQFKAFLDNEAKKITRNENPKTAAQFIHMYVLPNMLGSHLDISLFNRAFNLLTNRDHGVSNRKHVFHLVNFEDRVDSVYSDIIKNVKHSDRYYLNTLKNFPCVESSNFQQLMKLPDIAPTIQSVWSTLSARLKVLDFLLKLSIDNKLNKTDNNLILRTFKLYENDNALNILLPESMLVEMNMRIQNIKNVITSN